MGISDGTYGVYFVIGALAGALFILVLLGVKRLNSRIKALEAKAQPVSQHDKAHQEIISILENIYFPFNRIKEEYETTGSYIDFIERIISAARNGEDIDSIRRNRNSGGKSK